MIIWIIGKSGTGKTTVGKLLLKKLKKKYKNTVFLDGDQVRAVWGNSLGHSLRDREKNALYIFNLCRLLDRQKINVVCCIVSIFPKFQKLSRKSFKKFLLIHLKAPIHILKKRDKKKLYKKFYSKKIKNVVGLDIPFPKPYKPDLTISSYGKTSPKKIQRRIINKIFNA